VFVLTGDSTADQKKQQIDDIKENNFMFNHVALTGLDG